jgi:hypothetical protein
MPRISQFYGISIYMYYGDHAPPHLHAIYGDAEATFRVTDGSPLEGKLPRRAARMVAEWVAARQDELRDNWDRAAAGQPLRPVEPLE